MSHVSEKILFDRDKNSTVPTEFLGSPETQALKKIGDTPPTMTGSATQPTLQSGSSVMDSRTTRVTPKRLVRGGLFHNAQDGECIRTILEEMGHPQPTTMMITDNLAANNIANDIGKQKRSRAIDMRFYWIQDRIKMGHFHVFWRPGSENLTDQHANFSRRRETRGHNISPTHYRRSGGSRESLWPVLAAKRNSGLTS